MSRTTKTPKYDRQTSYLQVSVLAHDVYAIGFIVDKRLSIVSPLNNGDWLG